MSERAGTEDSNRLRLCDFIRANEHAIVEAWTREAQSLPPARGLSRKALIDHLPEMLARLAAVVESSESVSSTTAPSVHAIDRVAHGFDLEEVVTEYGRLRQCILELWEREVGPAITIAELCRLNAAVNSAVAEAAAQYARARERTLRALDRISEAALGSEDLGAFLPELLRATLDTMEPADVATIFLRDGEVLRIAATIGQEEDLERGFTLRIGEGLVGAIAAEGSPRRSRSAATDPLVRSESLRVRGVKALYGVPLSHKGAIIGVATLGSRTATELSEEHEILFRSMAQRAANVIVQSRLVEERKRAEDERNQLLERERALRSEAERTLALLETIFRASPVGIAFVDPELRYVRVNDALAAINGRSPQGHLGQRIRDVVPEVATFLQPALAQVLATRSPIVNMEFEGRPPSTPGETRAFLANCFPVVSSRGEVLGIGGVVVEITELKRSEAALRESEARFRALADNIPQLAWIADDHGWIFWYNERWLDYTGTTLEEMQGWGWQSVHHPDHLPRVVEKIRRHFDTGEPWEDTFPLRGRDGRYRWFLSRAIPLRDEHGRVVRWFGTNTDVTEELFLREASTIFASSLEFRETLSKIARLAVPALADWCAVDVLTRDGRLEQLAIEHVDPTKIRLAEDLRRLFPPDPAAPVGARHVLRTHQPELYEDIPDEILVQRASNAEQLAILRSLGLRSAMVVPMIARGRTVGVITFVSAESGRRYGRRELELAQEVAQRAAMALDNARLFREAQDAVRAREDILAVVSHDLKNPLSVISMAGTLVLGCVTDDALRRPVESIQRAAGTMDRLISDLLDMGSIQAGRLAIDAAPHDAETLVRQVLDLHAEAASKKQVALTCSLRLDGARVLCDRERIVQVFANLLGNAIKFCNPGDRVEVLAERAQRMIRFVVRDTGPGIQSEDLPHIFEPYWSARVHASKGTGLGLFITKGIVEAHGGQIDVESTPGVGTTFSFTLPNA